MTAARRLLIFLGGRGGGLEKTTRMLYNVFQNRISLVFRGSSPASYRLLIRAGLPVLKRRGGFFEKERKKRRLRGKGLDILKCLRYIVLLSRRQACLTQKFF
jgi:hypothetical protein